MATLATPAPEAPATTPVIDSAIAPPPRTTIEVTEAEIAARAFEIYAERGGEDGHDLDDWLQAERELVALRVRQATES